MLHLSRIGVVKRYVEKDKSGKRGKLLHSSLPLFTRMLFYISKHNRLLCLLLLRQVSLRMPQRREREAKGDEEGQRTDDCIDQHNIICPADRQATEQ